MMEFLVLVLTGVVCWLLFDVHKLRKHVVQLGEGNIRAARATNLLADRSLADLAALNSALDGIHKRNAEIRTEVDGLAERVHALHASRKKRSIGAGERP